ncbi:alpha/beta hydrolase [uncultured Devosia sp.]|uniref:alpha/beta hydrolase n=1 Tax=uncultured Devosia sp. TaxID=211434 RepID=UPI00263804D4|nr:alpha/beta hydrolase [uncultured Devosia sp.]
MSKEQLDFILRLSAENPPPANATPPQMREWFEAINAQTPIAEGAMIETISVGPCPAELVRLPGSDENQLVIYYHGGGFLFGSPRSHRTIATHLAKVSGATVLSVDYRLAPEHPAPTAHDDAYAAYFWALEHGYAPASIVLSGDSAGGNLALSTAVRARDNGVPLPSCLVLMSPALDFASEGESHRTLADAPLVNRELMGLFNAVYIGAGDLRSPQVTPFYGDVSGLPPVLVHVGSWELLRDDSITIADRINASGGSAELKVWEGMCHSWQLFAPMLEEGMASIEEAGGFMRRHTA